MKFIKNNKKIIIVVIITIISVICFITDIFSNKKNNVSNEEILEITDEQIESNKDREKNDEDYLEGASTQDFNEEDVDTNNDGNVNDSDKDIENNANTNISDKTSQNEDMNLEKDNNKIYIYITGEVNNRGVVILKEGSRISDAIDAAGGITEKANISKINLVYILLDGMKVNIPSDNDLKNNPDFEYVTTGYGDGIKDTSVKNISTNTGEDKSHSASKMIVNINTATQTELETLPGIGPSLALKIINYRNENGKFNAIDDIKNVSGIGDSKFENIREFIKI